MPIYQVIVLAIVQGLAELLPVSSSAHVVVAEKLMGIDPSTPQMTLLLVMLHTGTMFAVIAYFWRQWRQSYFATADAFKRFALRLIYATALTGIVGEALIKLVEHTMFKGAAQGGDRRALRAAGPGRAGARLCWDSDSDCGAAGEVGRKVHRRRSLRRRA